jgi:hypothetical protein
LARRSQKQPIRSCRNDLWIRKDRMVVCAVRYEPVSTCNSLLTGKLTGNFVVSGLLQAILVQKATVPQALLSKFPTKINREIIFGNREISGRNRDICNASAKQDEMSSVRERYGEAFWRAHHKAWQQSELNQREYCVAQGIRLKAFGTGERGSRPSPSRRRPSCPASTNLA